MRLRSPAEYVVLGALISGPMHGYQIMQFLGFAIESTWRVSTSQLYVLFKRLEREGLLQSTLETQETRPSRRVFEVTDEGKRIFLKWLHTPSAYVRDFRMEFLTKLFFFHRLSQSGANELVDDQIQSLKMLRDKLRKRSDKENDPFKKLVYGFKMQTMESILLWLSTEARLFARRCI